jgi:hypothetical protein
VILEAGQVPRLNKILGFAQQSTRIVRLSFGISGAYNLIGVSIAAAGILSPLICAILMPLSSLSVVLFACGMTRWSARKLFIANKNAECRTTNADSAAAPTSPALVSPFVIRHSSSPQP